MYCRKTRTESPITHQVHRVTLRSADGRMANSSTSQRPSSSMKQAVLKPRALLNSDNAIAIFQLKKSHQTAVMVGRYYGVSEKAIRDIWTGRTWAAETWHLDKSRTIKIKPSGRPTGSLDKTARKPRQPTRLHPHSDASNQAAAAFSWSYHGLSTCSEKDASTTVDRKSTNIHDLPPFSDHQYRLLRIQGQVAMDGFCAPDARSVDEQLFDWDCDGHGVILFDPFKGGHPF